MGVVQKGPTLTLFFGPQKTSFFRLFSTFSGFSQKRNRPTDATFDKNRSKKQDFKKRVKNVKKSNDPKKRSTKKKTIQKKYRLKKKAKKRKNRSHLSDRAKIKNVPFKEMKTNRKKTKKNREKVHKKSIKSKIGQKTSKIVKKPEK